MINVLVIVMECITMWLCLHIAFGEKIKKTKGEVVFFVVYVLVFAFCSYGAFIEMLYFFLWVFIVIWSKVLFKRRIFNTIIRTIAGIIAVGVIEIVVMFLYSFFANEIKLSMEVECVLVGVLVLLFAAIVYYVANNKKIIYNKDIFDKGIIVLVLFIALFLFYVKLEFEVNRVMPIIYVFFFAVLAVIFVYLCKKQKSMFELEKRNLNLELQNMYGNAYEDLLSEVRRRQHDYKNQLAAIYSMHTTAATLEELKAMQEEYLGIMKGESEFDNILTKCNNPIIAGYLYNMCIKYSDKYKIKVDVLIEQSEVNIKTKDIIEVLGVLLTNAIEYLDLNDKIHKDIDVTIHQSDDKMNIIVKNASEYVSYDVIGKMFEHGYSTKGNNRGIGLYSVKNIVNKYDGEIYVDNIQEDDTNWLTFKIVI